MARPRWTWPTLILVCSLPVLATVVTAFRILDVPVKSNTQKSSKLDFSKASGSDTCDECGIKDGDIVFGLKLHSVKIQSVPLKRNNVEIKHIKESDEDEDQSVKIKKVFHKETKKSATESKDYKYGKQQLKLKDDDALKQDKSVKPLGSKIVKSEVKEKPFKKEVIVNDDPSNDDEDDNDDDDDISDGEWSTKMSNIIIDKHKYNEKNATSPKVKTNQYVDEDDDNDDDEDDDDENDDDDDNFFSKGKLIDNKKQFQKYDDQKNKASGKLDKSYKIHFYYGDSNDDDEDDSNEDEIATVPKSTKTEEQVSEKLKIVPRKPVEITKQEKETSENRVDTAKTVKVEEKIAEKKQEKISKDLSKQESPKIQIKEHRSESIKSKDTSGDKVKILKSEIDKKEKALPKRDDVNVKPPELKKREEQKPKDSKSIIDSTEKKPVESIDKKEIRRKEDEKTKDTKSESSKKETKSQTPEKDGIKVKKPERTLKPVSEALHRRNMLISKFEDLYSFFPTFSPNFSLIHNPECRRHGQILMRQLHGIKLWALNMLDATAKIPSGILQGNGIQLGDFDQCLGSKARVQLDTGTIVKVQGKYCLAYLDIKAEHPELELPVHLAQAKNLIKSRIDDPGHFVPRFSTLSWGVCLPAACGSQDAEVVIKDALKHYQHTTGLVVKVRVNENDCHTDHANEWDTWLELPTMLTLAFYVIVLMLVTIATLQDFLKRRNLEDSGDSKNGGENEVADEEKKKPDGGFLTVFSLYQTLPKLVAPVSKDDIGCIHGLRALSTLALLAAHKFIPVAVIPYNNRLKITETVSAPWWSVFRAGWMYTDCFLLLSGTLSVRRLASDSDSAPRRFFNRYIRLTPAHLAVILFYAYIWDKTSEGPLWGSLVTRNAELCQESWWWNLLYIHNYFNFEDMCAPQTHQLALDMQLSILAGVFVWLATNRPTMSKLLIFVLQAGATYWRYSVVSEHRLTMLVYHGVSVSQLYRTARLSYTSTLHRSTPYLMGVLLGMSLNKPSNISKLTSAFCLLVAGLLWSAVWWAGLDSGALTHRYSVAFAARYAALAPLAVASSLALFVYAVHNGRYEIVSRVLSSRPLMLISRLSYALYLCQFIVFLTNAAKTRSASEFTVMSLFDVQEACTIFLASVILTLTLVLPMQSVNSNIFHPDLVATKDAEIEELVKVPPIPLEKEEEKKATEVPVIRSRSILAHREVLEEIPEAEVEYEFQRERRDEGLEGILEEEEDDEIAEEEYEPRMEDEDMEILEGEDPGRDDEYWIERDAESEARRHYMLNNDQELGDWEWTNNNGRNGEQYWLSR